MKSSLPLGLLLLLGVGACKKDSPEDLPQPEYADWYALRAPDARTIEAVHGNIDGTLIITTRYAIYQTKDRGKTWQTAEYKSNTGLFGFAQRRDTLLALNGESTIGLSPFTTYAVHPSHFSLDEGATWQTYRNLAYSKLKTPRNRVVASSGTEYTIQVQRTPTSPNSASQYIETVGIETSAGRQFKLPQEHQITSLYFDTNSRLYVTTSAPLCGRRQDFKFCGEQNGLLYISKNPQL